MRKADAKKMLTRLVAEIDAHLADYGPAETFISHDLLIWLKDGATQSLTEGKRTLTLGQALSLEQAPKRPRADDAETIPPDIYKAWFIHHYDRRRQHRKVAKRAAGIECDKPKRLTWPRIAAMVKYKGDPDQLNKQVIRYQKAIARIHAERVWKRRA